MKACVAFCLLPIVLLFVSLVEVPFVHLVGFLFLLRFVVLWLAFVCLLAGLAQQRGNQGSRWG